MNPFVWLAKSLGFIPTHSQEELELLRKEFMATVSKFKQLITANRIALDGMTKIESAIEGNKPHSFGYVRSCHTVVSDNVYEMLDLLNSIAPDKYKTLYRKHEEITAAITPYLLPSEKPVDMPFVMSLHGMDRSVCDLVGEKMANVAEISTHVGLNTPPGFVITAQGYWEFIENDGLREKIKTVLAGIGPDQISEGVEKQSAEIRDLILGTPVPENLHELLIAHYKSLEQELGDNVSVAVRSSAQGEDAPGASCAGMYKTVLGVTGENLIDAYKEVVASKYVTDAMTYRLINGIRDDEVAICVGCMPLIKAVCGGVVYTGNPVDADDNKVSVHSVFGLPGLVVEGAAYSDVVVVSRDEPLRIVEHNIAEKKIAAVPTGSAGVTKVSLLTHRKMKPSISDEQALELTRQSLLIERHFGCAQDVEWAVDEQGSIVFLQSRPLLQNEEVAVEEKQDKKAETPSVILATGDVTASSGVSAGPIFIVRQRKDLADFPEGGVLVVRQPLPDWVSALRKASAVIAEQGSVAGHLANVAREQGVPALFRVKRATERLTNGTIVTVHAGRKKIYDGRNDSIISHFWEPKKIMEDTPVHKALKGAAQFIVPLTLLDPDDKKMFRPRHCKTLHDITRFCHEKSLHEMFSFGAEYRFKERAAKQLYVRSPSQFWVIDLADGFRADMRDNKYVRLDDIESEPMHAIWKGMMTIPWHVPKVNARGFFEVMMESTTNPGLNPSMASPYAERNYFMVTKDYCSCQTRFGYHFTTVEALVGENRQENFISFRFRGGAAGKRRRVNRVRLIASILEDHEIHVHVEGDSVHAQLKKFDAPTMLWGLNLFGYLMFHTRQLDMVLTGDKAIAHHRQRIEKDLAILKTKCTGK